MLKRLFIISALLLLSISVISGCTKKKTEEHQPAVGHADEIADSTRLDSAKYDEVEGDDIGE